jgi:hypothetical protein
MLIGHCIYNRHWLGAHVLATVATFREPWRAHILRGRLEAEGLLALVIHENHISVNWPWASALGEIKVQVLNDDLPAAQNIQRRCQDGQYQKELEALFGELEELRCPSCRSTSIESRSSAGWVAGLIVSYLTTGVIFPLPKSAHKCVACSRTWRT